mgnify:CR=1 FL=1
MHYGIVHPADNNHAFVADLADDILEHLNYIGELELAIIRDTDEWVLRMARGPTYPAPQGNKPGDCRHRSCGP